MPKTPSNLDKLQKKDLTREERKKIREEVRNVEKTRRDAQKKAEKIENEAEKKAKKESNLGFFANLKLKHAYKKDKRALRNKTKVKLHKSFKRSYREDYERRTTLSGLNAMAARAFKIIFKNWKLFIPLILIVVIANIILVGLMSQDTYDSFSDAIDETNQDVAKGQLGNVGKAGLMLIGTITSGGLTKGMSEVQEVFMVLILVITWLVTIYLVRHLLAGQKIRLRDGFYNALTPLISTFLIVAFIFIECIPIFIVTITYSAAVSTEFLNTPFYAAIYFVFAGLLILLSAYLLSSGLIALVAISAPGLYPVTAINTANDLIAGRRIRFIIRLLYLVLVLAIVWIVVMLPIILIDAGLKSAFEWMSDIPVVPFFLQVMTTFTVVYSATYLYLFYRELLDMD